MKPSQIDIQSFQQRMDQAIENVSNYPSQRYSGRGIVICGGGQHYFPCVWVCVAMLRHLDCQLPIELWHLGPTEISAEIRQLLAPLGVTPIDAYEVARQKQVTRLAGWELKPYAIINSRFEEVLLLDADNVVVQNPEFMFDTLAYREFGSVFWPDRYPQVQSRPWLRPEIWPICKLPNSQETEIESGQLLVNKAICWKALQLSLFFNEHSDFYYHFFYGDKDTYQVAWKKMGIEFAMIPHPLQDLHHDWTMAQHDFDGNRLFQHRSGAKWKLTGENIRVPNFFYEQECLGFLDQLRQCWSGTTRALPREFNRTEWEAFRKVTQCQRYDATIQYHPDSVLTMTPGLKVLHDQHGLVGEWEVTSDKDDRPLLKLKIQLDHQYRCELKMGQAGGWHGYWNQYEDIEAHLVPCGVCVP